MISTNVAGYFFITQRVVTQMRKQKSGHIVGISTAFSCRDDYVACDYQVHNANVSPRIGGGIRADGIRANTI